MKGNLVTDLKLGEGSIYHPGGIDYDGRYIWVAVAEYRPNSRSIIYRVDPATMTGHRGVPLRRSHRRHRAQPRRPHAARRELGLAPLLSLDARRRRVASANADIAAREAARRRIAAHYIDYQDCKYLGQARDALLRDSPTTRSSRTRRGSRSAASRSLTCQPIASTHQVPIQLWTASGLPMTQNPVWIEPTAHGLARVLHARGRQVDAVRLRSGREVAPSLASRLARSAPMQPCLRAAGATPRACRRSMTDTVVARNARSLPPRSRVPRYDPSRIGRHRASGARRIPSRAPGGLHRRRARARFALGHSRRVDEDAARDGRASPQQDGLYTVLAKGERRDVGSRHRRAARNRVRRADERGAGRRASPIRA